MDRIQQVRALVEDREADGVLLTFLPDVRWACGFSGSNGVLLVTPSSTHFFSDGRYQLQAAREVSASGIHITSNGLFDHLASLGLLSDERILFQSDHVAYSTFEHLSECLPEVTWQPATAFLSKQVAVKNRDEIDRITEALRITESVFERLLGFIRPGVSEKEIAAEIVYEHLKRGADKMSFDPIVASGPNGALPHATPTDRRIEPGDLIVLDIGCFVNGYASDMTRTVCVGQPSDEARTVYEVVLHAQNEAIRQARAGMPGKDLDYAARSIIAFSGYGANFTHSLGHGVGLQIHEWPRIAKDVALEIPAGAVVTIEPGIYVPDSFGVRIEDMVVITEEGCENLSTAEKELICL